MSSSLHPTYQSRNRSSVSVVAVLTTILCSLMSSSFLSAKANSIKLHEIKFNDLARLDELTALSVQDILSSIGILKISGIPNLDIAQEEAFYSLSSCLLNNDNVGNGNQIFTTMMEDGTKRLSIGAKSTAGQGGKLSHECGYKSSHLRSLVDLGTRQLFQALDLAHSLSVSKKMSISSSSKSNNHDTDDERHHYLMKPYQSFTELMNKGEHLEHIHTYYNSKVSPMTDNNAADADADAISESSFTEKVLPTMSMHTDAGLLIAMTTGYYPTSFPVSSTTLKGQQHQDDLLEATEDDGILRQQQRGLFINVSTGEIVHVDESDLTTNDLIIMVGAGGAEWLNPYFTTTTTTENQQPLRAVPHALVVELGSDTSATRNWYGKMFLPPLDAELFQSSSSVSSNVDNTSTSSSSQPQRELRNSNNASVQQVKKADVVSPPVTYKAYRKEELKRATSLSSTPSSTSYSVERGLKSAADVVARMEKSRMNAFPAACGQSLHNSPFALMVPQSCTVAITGDAGVMCWAQCMSTSTLNCAADAAPTCTDTATGEETDGIKMCGSSLGMKACKLTCIAPPTVEPTSAPVSGSNTGGDVNTPTIAPIATDGSGSGTGNSGNNIDGTSSSSSKNSFCIGPSGTSMSMTGFISSAADTGQESMCFVYLFPSWVLDDSIKFAFACLGTIGLGILIHALSKLKLVIHHYKPATATAASGNNTVGMGMMGVVGMNDKSDGMINGMSNTINTNNAASPRYKDSKSLLRMKFYASIAIYFVQIMLSYAIMLVAMTYNVELFFMVCVGLTIGYALFHPHNIATTAGNYGNDHKNDDNDIDGEERFSRDDGMNVNNNTNSMMTTKEPYSSISSSSSLNVHLEPCCQDLDYEAVSINSAK